MTRSRRGTAMRALARAHGIQLAYTDNLGSRHVATIEQLQAVLAALGINIESDNDAADALEQSQRDQPQWPVNIVAWGGTLPAVHAPVADTSPSMQATLTLESGESLTPTVRCEHIDAARSAVRLHVPEPLPFGMHMLTIESRSPDATQINVLSAPQRCHTGNAGDHAALGVFLPLYAARTSNDWGAGDLTSLAALRDWAGAAGARWVGTLPLLASYLDEPFDPSPYAPVSRLFWNELYCDVTAAPELACAREARQLLESTQLQAALDQLRGEELVDYHSVMRLKRQVIELLADAAFRNDATLAALGAFIADQPDLDDYARFRATVDRTRTTWQHWPARMQRGDIRDDDFDQCAWQYHVYAQWLVQRQLERLNQSNASDRCELYLDLPVGVHGGGYDVWRRQDEFATGLSVGAPPDGFFRDGQNWGFPPPRPRASCATGHSYFRAVLANHLRFAGMLRIDHIMALHRLYVIPDGASATEGVYIHYPADELFAIVAMESHRTGATMVGENLGTVPQTVNRAMSRRGVHGMSIAQIEFTDDPTSAVPTPDRGNLAALNTHDMPTFAAWWTGSDIQQRCDLGLLAESDIDDEQAQRIRTRDAIVTQLQHHDLVGHNPTISDVHDAILSLLAAGHADVLMINLEDLWQEQQPQNVPGISTYPSWRRRAARSLEQLIADDSIRDRITDLCPARSTRASALNRDRIPHRDA